MAMNTIIVSGNLVADAQVIATTNGKMAKVTIANNMGWGDNEKVTFYDILIFGARAESKLPLILKKGCKVVVQGEHSFALRTVADKQYYDNTIKMTEIEVMPREPSAAFNPRTEAVSSKPLPQTSAVVDIVGSSFSDLGKEGDIPF